MPRNKQASTLTASGLTSAGMTKGGRGEDQELDDESAAGLQRLKDNDAEIDAGIDAISKTIDNLSSIANTMKDEVCGELHCYDEDNDCVCFADGCAEQEAEQDRRCHDQDHREANGCQRQTEISTQVSPRPSIDQSFCGTTLMRWSE